MSVSTDNYWDTVSIQFGTATAIKRTNVFLAKIDTPWSYVFSNTYRFVIISLQPPDSLRSTSIFLTSTMKEYLNRTYVNRSSDVRILAYNNSLHTYNAIIILTFTSNLPLGFLTPMSPHSNVSSLPSQLTRYPYYFQLDMDGSLWTGPYLLTSIDSPSSSHRC